MNPAKNPLLDTTATSDSTELLALPQLQKVVLVMDLVESVRLMAANELAVVDHWRGFVRHATTQVLPQHEGRMVKSLGDGIMVEFESPRNATNAAVQLHRYFDTANATLPPEQQLYLRAGLNTAQVYIDDIDIYGSGVNLAARVASLAGPGETMVTAEVRDGLTDGLDAKVEDMGECYLKHVAQPVRAFRVGEAGPAPILTMSNEHTSALAPTVVVIPLRAFTNAAEQYAVGELIVDGVIAKLSKTPNLRVISRLTASALKDRNLPVKELGELASASYVVSGSYVLVNNKIRVSIELASTKDAVVLWQDQCVTDVEDLLSPQSGLCSGIASSIVDCVLATEARDISYYPLPNLKSATLMIGSISLMHQRTRRAMALAQQALVYLTERVPKQSDAHAWLAKSWVISSGQSAGTLPSEIAKMAMIHSEKALSFDDTNSLALTINGIVNANLLGNYSRAENAYAAALQADPNNALAWLYSAALASFQGNGSKAWAQAQQALKLSPIDPQKYLYQGIAATACLTNNDHAQALVYSTESLRLNISHMSAHRVKVISLQLCGLAKDARSAAAVLLHQAPTYTVSEFRKKNQHAEPSICALYADALKASGIPN